MIETIKERVAKKFGSLEEPDHSRVSVPTDSAIALKCRIEEAYPLEDVTDINDDVGFVLSLKENVNEYTVMISWVGAYAAILKMQDSEEACVINNTSESQLITEIADIIISSGYKILSKDILTTKIKFNAINSDDEMYPVYKILFTDFDIKGL